MHENIKSGNGIYTNFKEYMMIRGARGSAWSTSYNE